MVYLSHVFVPSPHGALRTVTCNFFVGMRTGPLTFNRFSLAPRIKSEHTFSKFFTFLEERVMRILWMRCASASPAFAAAGFPSTAADIITISASFEGEREKETTRQREREREREETKRKANTSSQGPKSTKREKRTGQNQNHRNSRGKARARPGKDASNARNSYLFK